ncbi:hypothetical protein A3860_33855 [Niastella vici]|uniref:Uncharacterized protein n=1 Tax=Niastella vici TaxID=1703345 RepID=A0A1V9FQ00_9BACT|nr:hypothetical protein [Niastella vici]OQP60367.1 hypothetical protein A3860_33855 [Niastella vici]
MTFQITIDYHKRKIRLSVEQLFINERLERYRVTASNGTIEIESNRPLFRSRGLKQRPGNWIQTAGKPLGDHALQLIAEAIQSHVEQKSSQ